MSWHRHRRPAKQKARPLAGLLFCARLRRALAALLPLFTLSACEPRQLREPSDAPAVRVTPVPIDALADSLRLSAELTLLGAFELASDDPRFGGFSGLLVDQGRLLLLSDRGYLWSGALAPDQPIPLRESSWRVVALTIAGRQPDAEDLARTGDGTLWVAIEGDHALAPLPPTSDSVRLELTPKRLPEPIASLPRNGGIEALAALPEGGLLALAETRRGEGHPALVLANGEVSVSSYPASAGFAPTAAEWVAGYLLVLERRFTPWGGFAARLVAWPAASAADLTFDTAAVRELARFTPSWAIDNFEGLAAEPPDREGAIRIWLITDDNFNRWQRTLLLLLRWQPQPALARASNRRLSGMSSSGSSASDTLFK